MPERPPFSSQEEYSFSLTQLMVVLDKPIGLTLAPDPTTGHMYVQHIEAGMSAAESKLVLVGDRLLSCSAVFGDEMWHAQDLQRTRWAINNRPGKVKLVLERGTGSLPPWYLQGREGIASWEVPEVQLPIRFAAPVGGELVESLPGAGRCLSVSFSRCMNPTTAEQVRLHAMRPGLLARRQRAEQLSRQLVETTASPEVDISSPLSRLLTGRDGAHFQIGVSGTPLPPGGTTNVLPFRRHGSSSGSSTPNPGANSNNNNSSSSSSGGGASIPPSPNNTNNVQSNNNSSSGAAAAGDASSSSSSSSSSAGGASNGSSKQGGIAPTPAAAAAAAAAGGGSAAGAGGGVVPMRDKKVVQVLPWLLVSNGRLNSADLTRLATTRALGCLLEMRLTLNHEGLLCPVGSQPPPFSLPAAPVPPTLSPSTVPAPAPVEPPPLPPEQQQQQQQQQEQEQEEQQQQQLDQQQQQQQQQQAAADAGALAAGLVGMAGPDVGFASAAAAAAAVAAAAAGADGQNSSSGQNQNPSSQNPNEPSPLTLQAHAILHCIADLHRLAATAVESVSKALGLTLNEAVLDEVQRLLVVRAKERFSRLMLNWPYGGGSAEVSGDLVGGWTQRVAMRRCLSPDGCLGASKGHFYLELKGLHPGRYHYKFIIDNNWDVDPAAPKTLDSEGNWNNGNWNNVLDVVPPPRIESAEEEAHFAALHAMALAFERKLRVVSSIGGN
ncbi:hypothetical protein OEZ85_000301 [Tetradesmus obliquus]|uniref:AMP-activated protein kinase glycogen-binding domain-containing protein n=1 Tax=Tetradesmus obliquus TaxID=3088 RepID=A0ABY8UPU7_TETOB|nr:hypothetical protein OEZ85_000301 [Tetradesmus obliquus]WIA23590.1 hypothetical protein OEZ85_000301 [Tetradesmus obliquus]